MLSEFNRKLIEKEKKDRKMDKITPFFYTGDENLEDLFDKYDCIEYTIHFYG